MPLERRDLNYSMFLVTHENHVKDAANQQTYDIEKLKYKKGQMF